jgi:hypothetical protein
MEEMFISIILGVLASGLSKVRWDGHWSHQASGGPMGSHYVAFSAKRSRGRVHTLKRR